MVQNPAKVSGPSTEGTSALDIEAERAEQMMKPKPEQEGSTEAKKAKSGLNNATQVDQDNRVAKAQADAKAAGGGPNKPQDGLNQDG